MIKPSENNRPLKRIKAVILDMDGLMIDSESLHCKAYDTVLKQYGYGLNAKENSERYVGISDPDISRDLISRYNLPIKPEKLAFLKQQEYRRLLGNEVIPQAGLLELLNRLKSSGFKVAIASSATTEEIKTVVKKLKIEPFINSITSSYEVENGKPKPDLFLHAAQKINIPPSNCLVLEDAPSGILAAKAAGMYSFAIPSSETKDKDFSKATKKLNRLSEVFQFIA